VCVKRLLLLSHFHFSSSKMGNLWVGNEIEMKMKNNNRKLCGQALGARFARLSNLAY